MRITYHREDDMFLQCISNTDKLQACPHCEDMKHTVMLAVSITAGM